MDYPGKVITKTQVTPTQTSASGNWTLDDQAAAIKNNNWPVALVPNPISKSLRFNNADSANLTRTPGSAATSSQKFTVSFWVKRTNLSTDAGYIFGNGVTAGAADAIGFNSSDQLNFEINGTTSGQLVTTQVFRDVSSWYHIVYAVDTTQATASNRIKVYVNGVQVTAFGTASYPSQNYNFVRFNQNTYAQYIGFIRGGASSIYYLSGYLAEIYDIDGQQLDPTSFGMTNPQTGQWIPLKYSGTYGTNGFYLNFKDATSTTTLGYDYSGNANNWTANNFSVTAGAGNDSLTDVPTPWFAYNTTGDVGGVIRGNYCTLTPLVLGSLTTLSNGNLQAAFSNWNSSLGTMAFPTTGKWYYEVLVSSTEPLIGIAKNDSLINSAVTTYFTQNSTSYGYYTGGSKHTGPGNSSTSYGASFTSGDLIGVALDSDNGTLTFYKNGSSQGTAFTSLVGPFLPVVGASNGSLTVNFGQRPFAYTPPTGFRSLCTTNLPATAIGFGLTNQGGNYFNPIIYTGDGTNPRSLTGVGFQPDFVWIKARSTTYWHRLADSVRGVGKELFSNATDAEVTNNTQGSVQAFNSDGFTLSGSSGNSDLNGSGITYVAWNWKASGSTVSNTAGTITSTVSANTTAGFSIVTYTGTGTNGATVGHGLGVVPDMIIIKRRNSTGQWATYHSSIGNTGALRLNTTSATITDVSFWNNTSPTSTVFTIGVDGDVNTNTGTYVAYCFDAIPGYSAFGSYTGNGSADGPFVYMGFRPEFVMVKRTDTAGNEWEIRDAVRDPYNSSTSARLWANSNAELNDFPADLLSNGFKPRSTGTNSNGSGATYIYMAFAEFPFQFANAR
jgi:hypothetical protein